MNAFQEKIQQQEETAAKLEKLFVNYRKEPKRYLKRIDRLTEWYDRLRELWDEYSKQNNVLSQEEEQFIQTDYFKERCFDKMKLKYENMFSNLKLRIGVQSTNENDAVEQNDSSEQNIASELQVEDADAETPQIQQSDEDDSDEEVHENRETPQRQRVTRFSDQNFDLRKQQNDDIFKTPRAAPFPKYVEKHLELRNRAVDMLNRFNSKAKLFSKELDTIEGYLSDGLKIRAKLSLKDIERWRNDLSDYMEEVYFILGDSATEYEVVYDSLITRYRTMLEEITTTKEKNSVESAPLKLKPLEIPTFYGAIKAWPTFSGLFKTMIISNNTLSDIQKMQYLKTSVKGEAAQLIANMEISNENFLKA